MNKKHKGGFKAYLIWSIASLFYLYEYFVRVVPSVMEHELEVAFAANATQLATAIGMYLMIYSPMQLFVGPLFDIYGTRKLLVPASLVLAISCFLPIIPSSSLTWFGSGRFLMGFSSAFGFVGVMYLCTVWFPPSRLAMLSGLTTALGMIGAIIGQAVLSGIVNQFKWQATWHLCAGFGIIVTLLLWVSIPKHPDWIEVADQSSLWRSFFKSLVQVIKNKQTWIIGFCSSCLFMPLSVFADMWGIQYLMTLTGSTKSQAVSVVAMLYLGWTVGAPIAGWFSDHAKTRKKPLVWSSVFCFILSAGFLLLNHVSLYVLGLFLFLLGLLSSGQVVGFIASIELNPPYAKGTAISAVNMITMWLGGIIQTLVGIVLDLAEGATHIQHVYSVHSYKVALSLLPLLLLLSTLLTFFGMRECFAPHQANKTKELDPNLAPNGENA